MRQTSSNKEEMVEGGEEDMKRKPLLKLRRTRCIWEQKEDRKGKLMKKKG